MWVAGHYGESVVPQKMATRRGYSNHEEVEITAYFSKYIAEKISLGEAREFLSKHHQLSATQNKVRILDQGGCYT